MLLRKCSRKLVKMASNLSEKVRAINAMEKVPEKKKKKESKEETPPIILRNIDGTPQPVLPDSLHKNRATLSRYLLIGLALVAALVLIDLIRLFRGF